MKTKTKKNKKNKRAIVKNNIGINKYIPTEKETIEFARMVTPDYMKFFSGFQEFCKEFVRHCKAGKDRYELIVKFNPELSEDVFRGMYAFGNDEIYMPLAVNMKTLWAQRLKNLSLIDQEKAYERGVSILLENGSRIVVKAPAMTQKQLYLAFSTTRIRTIKEQRSYMKDQAAKKVGKGNEKLSEPYFINEQGHLVIAGKEFTEIELYGILQEMAKVRKEGAIDV